MVIEVREGQTRQALCRAIELVREPRREESGGPTVALHQVRSSSVSIVTKFATLRKEA
jgi:hypothetical protein